MSKAARGAFWTVFTSSAARAVGLAGTLLLTRYLDPDEYGEISLAAVVILTANTVSNCGLSQYIVSKPDAGREAAFHATFYFTVLGVLALAASLLLGGPIGSFVHAPGIVRFLPGLAFAMFLERIATVQDRIQVRDMRFRSVGLIRSLGEIVYSVLSVVLAAVGQGHAWGGGNAVVIASIARSAVRLVALSFTTPRREWLEPCRITWAKTRDLFAFGLPMSVATLAGFGSRKWDNLVFSYHFGQGAAGIYNLAYNLADIPAAQISETIGDVLVPSFAKMDTEERRRKALMLAMRQMTLMVAPLAFGLGAVAPLLAGLFDARWASIDLAIAVLSILSVVRPIGWIGSSYLQVKNMPRTIMILETAKPFVLVGLMHVFALYGPRILGPSVIGRLGAGEQWACAAVGVVFALNSLSYMLVFRRTDGLSLTTQLRDLAPPLVACAPMVAAVIAVQAPLAHLHINPVVKLGIAVGVGAAVFIPSAFIVAPRAAREFISLLGAAMAKRRGCTEATVVS
ncbi:Succinoglycan biosynthesis transport protein exoT [Minicystis rosea]|nr:Succinoglycan biosynthesis transport protein exoT [Minicystis rosea]